MVTDKLVTMATVCNYFSNIIQDNFANYEQKIAANTVGFGKKTANIYIRSSNTFSYGIPTKKNS